MSEKLSNLLFKIPYKTRVALVLLYFFPAFVDLLDKKELYFHNILWFFYLIPTLIIVFNKGIKWGWIATGISSVLFLLIESTHMSGIDKHDVITLIELTIVNILITLAVGILVKRNYDKQDQLNETRNLLTSILNNLDIGIWSMKGNQQLLASNGIKKIYGFSLDHDLSSNEFWKKSIHSDDLYIAEKIDKKWEARKRYQYIYRIIRPNGEIRWVEDRGIPVFTDNGELLRYDGTNIDVTRQKELEFQLIESEQKYKNLLEKATVGVFLIQDNNLVFVNQWFTHILGIPEQELLKTNLFEHINSNDRLRVQIQFEKLYKKEITFLREEIQLDTPTGEEIFLELQVSLSSIEGATAIIGITFDVTDKRKAMSKIKYIAYHDSLTGVLNMNYLNDCLTKELQMAKTSEIPVCMMFFNLDRFKLINDAFGHQIGDRILQMVTKRLVNLIEPVGNVIRAGGDDFILYLPNTNHAQAENMAKLVLKEFSEPIYLEEQEFRIAASIGIAHCQPEDTMDDVITKASSSLHFAKEFGRNQYQFYNLEFGKIANRRLQLEQRLLRAFEQNELEVYYQPKLDLFSNRITGMEALLRWNDEVLGPVSPAEFIPIAEETGLIVGIGKWVLETACRQNNVWQQSGLPPMQVCVNISSKQFLQDDFVPMVEQVLKDSQLSPELLNLEITEGIALYNIEDAIDKLEQIKRLHVCISLDDFGTGYSSLSYIKSLPIDFLKIDRAFIMGISHNNQDSAIVESTISLAHSLGFKVVAEGVEDHQQFGILGKLGCDEIQGFYIARPMDSIGFGEFLDGDKNYNSVLQLD